MYQGEELGMKTFAPINIVVHYPTTEDGWRELKHRMSIVHADAVLNSITKLKCPTSQKEKLLLAIIDDTKAKIEANQTQESN